VSSLHLVTEDVVRPERGTADLEDAFYFWRSQIDAPRTEDIYRTDYRTDGGGVVDVYIRSQAAFARWCVYLGLDFVKEQKGQALLCTATGTVRYLNEDHRVRLHHTIFADGGELS
jgi:hypothetical protein